jgi:uncharacterized protein YkwD
LKGIKRLVFFILIGLMIWYFYGQEIKHSNIYSFFQHISFDLKAWKEDPNTQIALQTIEENFQSVWQEVDTIIDLFKDSPQSPSITEVEKPDLETPLTYSFSIHNIEIGDPRIEVENLVGEAKRSTMNEYGVVWNTYHYHYKNFFMVAYNSEDKVAGLYTNQDLIASKKGIKLDSPKQLVLEQLGQPETFIRKGLINYQLQHNEEYHLFHIDNSYITIFYDQHENNTVTAIQIIDEKLEKQKSSFYAEASPLLKEGFEFQLFDLTNAARVVHGLDYLEWNEEVKETARKHSADMATNQYFDHTNLEGQSPFDRMKEDQISFRAAGENLATGQVSSIFAHEGLMNSLGHRENILQEDFESLGIGVAFDTDERPYYTENFLAQ